LVLLCFFFFLTRRKPTCQHKHTGTNDQRKREKWRSSENKTEKKESEHEKTQNDVGIVVVGILVVVDVISSVVLFFLD